MFLEIIKEETSKSKIGKKKKLKNIKNSFKIKEKPPKKFKKTPNHSIKVKNIKIKNEFFGKNP